VTEPLVDLESRLREALAAHERMLIDRIHDAREAAVERVAALERDLRDRLEQAIRRAVEEATKAAAGNWRDVSICDRIHSVDDARWTALAARWEKQVQEDKERDDRINVLRTRFANVGAVLAAGVGLLGILSALSALGVF
jgi:hypothetical protein